VVCGTPVSRAGATMCLGCIQKTEKGRRPRFPGGARTEFGTRVAKAITCVRCGKQDYLAFKPKDPDKVMCKDCTLEVVGLNEHGDPVQDPLMEIVCQQCGKESRIPRRKPPKPGEEDVEPILCSDCFMGIETRQGNKSVTGERRKSGVILKRKT